MVQAFHEHVCTETMQRDLFAQHLLVPGVSSIWSDWDLSQKLSKGSVMVIAEQAAICVGLLAESTPEMLLPLAHRARGHHGTRGGMMD